jgi:hypothetical protein
VSDHGRTGLSAPEAAILEAVTWRLVPTGDDGLGAREANVVQYILRALTTDYAVHRVDYAHGLAAVDAEAVRRHRVAFVELPANEQDAILADLERGTFGDAPFFDLVLRHTIEGMFGDPRWGGNADLVGWRLLGYPGPRASWTFAEQQLDTLIPPDYGAAHDRLPPRDAGLQTDAG